VVSWDIPLLEGYDYIFPENSSRNKGSHHYNGIINPDLIKQIESWTPDAILVYGWKFRSHLALIRHFKNKIPVWFRGDSTLLDEVKGIQSLARNILLRWVYSHIDRAFYTGSANRDYFIKYGLKPEQLTESLHAVDNQRFASPGPNGKEKAIELRRKLQIEDEDLVFLYAGKLIQKKGVESLVKAFLGLKQSHAHLVIAGNGILENYLKNKYSHLERIHFLGFQNQVQMPVIYRTSDVFVLPSTGPGESWGLAVNEAMASGKGVLVSDQCGCANDLVEEGKNGYIFRAGQIGDLTDKLSIMISKKGEISNFGHYSSEKIQQFTFNQFVTEIENQFNL
jgi:glycosyltransferase involved in cell wall biosynthesis